jgi:Flp pilus assembly protein TadD
MASAVAASREPEAMRAGLLDVVRLLQQTVEEQELSAAAWEQIGLLAGVAGTDEGNQIAVAAYERALSLDDERPISRNNLAMQLIAVADSASLDRAQGLVEPLLSREDVQQSNAHAAILDTRASVAVAKGDLAEALEYIDRAIRSQPEEPEWMVHRAEVLYQQGNESEARDAARAAARLMALRDRSTALRERLQAVQDGLRSSS